MSRYHINPRTGDPGLCKAKISCPYGTADEHFPSEEKARAAYEAGQLSEVLPRLNKLLDAVVPAPVERPTSRLKAMELQVGTGLFDGVLVERASRSPYASEYQLNHEVGPDYFVGTRELPHDIYETVVISKADGELIHSITTSDYTVDSLVGQQEQAIDWAAHATRERAAVRYSAEHGEPQVPVVTDPPTWAGPAEEEPVGMTDETMQEMDEYYQANPVEGFEGKPFPPENEAPPF